MQNETLTWQKFTYSDTRKQNCRTFYICYKTQQGFPRIDLERGSWDFKKQKSKKGLQIVK